MEWVGGGFLGGWFVFEFEFQIQTWFVKRLPMKKATKKKMKMKMKMKKKGGRGMSPSAVDQLVLRARRSAGGVVRRLAENGAGTGV